MIKRIILYSNQKVYRDFVNFFRGIILARFSRLREFFLHSGYKNTSENVGASSPRRKNEKLLAWSLFVFLLLGFYQGAFSQSFRFDYYGVADGISEDFVYSIVQDNNGYLYASSDEGIFTFNGFNFQKIYTEGGKTKYVRSFKSSDGTLWFGKNKGGIVQYREVDATTKSFVGNSLLKNTGTADAKNEKIEQASRITAFFEDKEGSVWVISQNSGVFVFDTNNHVRQLIKGLEEFNIFSFAKTDAGFLIGTDTGLYTATLTGDEFSTTEVDEVFYTNITSITKHQSDYLIGTESLGAFRLSYDRDLKVKVSALKMGEMDLSGYHINHIFNDNNNSIWVSTNKNGLLQLCINEEGVCHEMIVYNQGGLKEVKTVNECFIDREHNVWLASIDEGIVSLRNDFFSFYQLNNISPDRVARAILKNQDNSFWIGTENRLLRCGISPWRVIEEFSENQGLPISEYTSIAQDSKGTLWVGSIDKGVFFRKAEDVNFSKLNLPVDFVDKAIYSITIHKDKVYISTDFGLLEIADFKVKNIYSMKNGLPHNKISSTYSLGDRLMIASRANEITYLREDSIYIEKIPMTHNYRDSGMMQYSTDADGKLWVCTNGAGISSVEGKNSLMLTEEDGLMSNFVHSIISDKNNQLWLTHRGGLSKYNIEEKRFTTYDPVEGRKIDFSNNASVVDEVGRLWFGTNRGLLRYRADLDVANDQSPIINIIEVEVNEEKADYYEKNKIRVDYQFDNFSIFNEKKYNIKVQFEGISLKKPEGVVYYYKVESEGGRSKPWQKTMEREIVREVSAGNYTFMIKAVNSDGVGGDLISSIDIFIDKPIWLKPWFWIVLSFSILSLFVVVVKIREKRLKKIQEYLQRELDARTKEVVSQKEVLEVINNDLTDSIEYAKNIQTAILPAPNALPSIFEDAFVFYKPRDIVSGDFYWVVKNQNIITVAVADCTGHGVPGAFMSLIGSALLKDISSRSDVNSPDTLMYQLDRELKDMLNKKNSRFGVHDGMDITVLEYDLTTKKLKICSGKRPVVLYIEGKQVLMKGDRASVGGYGETKDKKFTLNEFQLKKGDRFYMYSDGIVDQFGGERGKKLKNRAFLALLDELQQLPISEQRKSMELFFNNWKGELAQIDDVIVVGIEV